MGLILWAAVSTAVAAILHRFTGDSFMGWKLGGAALLGLFLSGAGTDRRCADGWLSPSIGTQGACSHHGGVSSFINEFGWLLLLASIVVIALIVLTAPKDADEPEVK